jgi:predicted metal-dependent phosphoesterase TrpH
MGPREIIAKASELKLGCVSITDHDSFGGIDDAIEAAAEFGVDFIPGVELSTYYKGQDVHVLGYFVDHNHTQLNSKLQRLRDSRESRARRIVEKFQSLGVDLDWAAVEKLAQGEAVGRPHIAQALVDKGLARNIGEVFEKYLARDKPAYVAKYVLDMDDIFDIVHKAGGLASLAHPGHWNVDEDILKKLKDRGLDAIEVWHTDHTEADTRRFMDWAGRLELLMTGGSDCHGTRKKHGFVMGSLDIPDTIIEPLKQRALDIRSASVS